MRRRSAQPEHTVLERLDRVTARLIQLGGADAVERLIKAAEAIADEAQRALDETAGGVR